MHGQLSTRHGKTLELYDIPPLSLVLLQDIPDKRAVKGSGNSLRRKWVRRRANWLTGEVRVKESHSVIWKALPSTWWDVLKWYGSLIALQPLLHVSVFILMYRYSSRKKSKQNSVRFRLRMHFFGFLVLSTILVFGFKGSWSKLAIVSTASTRDFPLPFPNVCRFLVELWASLWLRLRIDW